MDWWSRCHIMRIVPYQRKVTMTTVKPRGVVPLLPLCSQIDVGTTVNSLLGDTFSHENNTHWSRLHDRDPQFASRILGAMTQSCYIGICDIRSRVIRGPYCTVKTPYNTNVGVQKIPNRAIWKPVVAKRNNTNPWSCPEPQILVTRDSRQLHMAKQPASRDRLE